MEERNLFCNKAKMFSSFLLIHALMHVFFIMQNSRSLKEDFDCSKNHFLPSSWHFREHFVPWIFICLRLNIDLWGSLAGPLACSSSRFSLFASRGMLLINVWRTKRSKIEQHNTNSADEISSIKEITAVYIQSF